MNYTATTPTMPSLSLTQLPKAVLRLLDRVPVVIPQLFFRFGMALVFWRSAQSKLASWDTTITLFREEYRVPVLPPELAAYLATTVELTTPVLLVLGLATRLGAAAMLGMALVIQVFVYPENYPDHILWAGPLLYLILRTRRGIARSPHAPTLRTGRVVSPVNLPSRRHQARTGPMAARLLRAESRWGWQVSCPEPSCAR